MKNVKLTLPMLTFFIAVGSALTTSATIRHNSAYIYVSPEISGDSFTCNITGICIPDGLQICIDYEGKVLHEYSQVYGTCQSIAVGTFINY